MSQVPEAETEEDEVVTPAQMVIIVIVAGFCFLLGTVSVHNSPFLIDFLVSAVSSEMFASSIKDKA